MLNLQPKLRNSNEGSIKNIVALLIIVMMLALLYLAVALANDTELQPLGEAECSIPNMTIYRNPLSAFNLNLKDFCPSKENDTLQFQSPLDSSPKNIAVTIEGYIATLIPHADFVGDSEVRFIVTDSLNYSAPLAFNLTVAEPPAEPPAEPAGEPEAVPEQGSPAIIYNNSALSGHVAANISSSTPSFQEEEAQPIQGTAEVGKPVMWTKKVKPRPNQEPEKITVAIPSSAFDVKVKRDNGEEIQAQVMQVQLLQQEQQANAIVNANINANNATVVITDTGLAAEYEVQYFTEAPLIEETEGKGTLLKNVRVHSTVQFHYSNVKASTAIKETAIKPSLYHFLNGTRGD